MNHIRTILKISFISFLLIINFQNVQSQSIDIDIDPIAYVLKGFSIHAGLNTDHIRYDIGVFGIEVPESFHGNDGFNNYMWGAGAKADYYFKGTEKGLYTGFGMDLTSSRVRLEETGNETSVTQFGAGINIGYKIGITKNLFVKPWFGLSYLFNADDIVIDGQAFEQSSIRPFPTVHVGWTF